MTVRDRINNYRTEILKGELQPGRGAEILTEISALLGNIGEETLERQMAYNKKLSEFLESEKTATKARIQADISEEYRALKTAQNIEKVAIEVMRSLKYFLKSKEDEWRGMNNL